MSYMTIEITLPSKKPHDVSSLELNLQNLRLRLKIQKEWVQKTEDEIKLLESLLECQN